MSNQSSHIVSDAISRAVTKAVAVDPKTVASQVLADLTPEQYEAALVEVLPSYVRLVFSRRRMLTPEVADVLPKTAGSSKVAAVRRDAQSRYVRMLETPIPVESGWKRLADCTRDEVLSYADALHEQAEATEAKALWYERLAGRLSDGQRVADLPEEVLAA